jgi:hypothetical protein
MQKARDAMAVHLPADVIAETVREHVGNARPPITARYGCAARPGSCARQQRRCAHERRHRCPARSNRSPGY